MKQLLRTHPAALPAFLITFHLCPHLQVRLVASEQQMHDGTEIRKYMVAQVVAVETRPPGTYKWVAAAAAALQLFVVHLLKRGQRPPHGKSL